MIISIFLPNLGCNKIPCVFCNQVLASDTDSNEDINLIKLQISKTIYEHLTKAENIDYPIEVAIYGATFTALDFGLQKEIIRHIQSCLTTVTNKNHNDNLYIRVSTRPDYIVKEQILDLKIRFNLKTVELGVQSMDDNVLFLSNRGHTREDVVRATKILKEFDIDFSCHHMLGLPGSNELLDINTARDISKLRPKYVRIHPTLILKNTLLEKMYLSGEYRPLKLEEAISLTEKIINIYNYEKIQVIRVGLRPTESLLNSIVAGPWHPAFRDLVEGKILLNKASRELENHKGKNSIQISISPNDEGTLRGKDNSNIKYLQNFFNISNIELVKDEKVKRGTLEVSK